MKMNKCYSKFQINRRKESKGWRQDKIHFVPWLSAPIGAWKCDFPPFYEIMTDRPTNNGRTGHVIGKLHFFQYPCTIDCNMLFTATKYTCYCNNKNIIAKLFVLYVLFCFPMQDNMLQKKKQLRLELTIFVILIIRNRMRRIVKNNNRVLYNRKNLYKLCCIYFPILVSIPKYDIFLEYCEYSLSDTSRCEGFLRVKNGWTTDKRRMNERASSSSLYTAKV